MNLTAIAIVAIICWCIVELRNSSVKKSKNSMNDTQKEEFQRQIKEMNGRIETLERIVTDEKYQLKREFDSLNRESA